MFSLFKNSQTKFISGRISEQSDIIDNFFYLRTDSGEIMSEPYKVEVPQNVIYTDPKTGQESEAFLVQAEKVTKTEMKGDVVCALRVKDGSIIVCQLKEIKLSEK